MLTKTDFKRVRDIVFLKDILLISLTTIGGPEMHLSVFLKKLVYEKKYLSENDFLELNSLCQILPGPSSTQLLTAIAHKMGGWRLALISLFFWVMPAAILMTIFAITSHQFNSTFFKYIGPMVLGFILVTSWNMSKPIKNNYFHLALAFISCIVSVVFHTPITFPILLIFGAYMNVKFGKNNCTTNNTPLKKIKWGNLTLLFGVLIFAAIAGAITRKSFPGISEPVRLFENTYRMGTMAFGGGNVLYSMIITEFVEFKQKQYLTIEEFNTGLGLLQAIPGPTFTIATYVNGLAMKKMGYEIGGQILGCGLGTIAIFLPGAILIFFVYPIWNYIKNYPIVYRSLSGIIAVSIGFVWAAAVFMLLPYVSRPFTDISKHSIVGISIFIASILYLRYTKLPVVLLVLITILAGILF